MEQVAFMENMIKEIASDLLSKLSYTHPVIGVGISNRHIHLSKRDLCVLFGEGYVLKKQKDLSQTGQYAAKEVLSMVGPKGVIEGVRILGPEREQTQIEVLMSDTYKLGIRAPIRDSGDVKGSAGIVLSGPKGVVRLVEGVIVARRHIHMSMEDAVKYDFKDQDRVSVSTKGDRGVTFKNVLIRIHPSFRSEFHIDNDEANAADLIPGDIVEICK